MSLAVGAPGAYTLVIKPTARVLAALRRGRVLEVTVSTRFSNRAGGPPVTRAKSVRVTLTRPKRKRARR